MLSLENITVGYGNLTVLHKVSFCLKANQIIAIIGPNGAGKSTVIKSIFNLAKVKSGEILFKNEKITHLPTYELIDLGISYVNQGRINFNNLTVHENLIIGAEMRKKQDLIEKNIQLVYHKFPVLHEKRGKLAYSLSGGQQQMLALGRALMQNPVVLLLDEPSLGLSPKLQKQLFKSIVELREEGMAIIIVEQNAKKAIEIADRTYLLEDGKVVLEGDKRILKHQKIQEVYLGGRY